MENILFSINDNVLSIEVDNETKTQVENDRDFGEKFLLELLSGGQLPLAADTNVSQLTLCIDTDNAYSFVYEGMDVVAINPEASEANDGTQIDTDTRTGKIWTDAAIKLLIHIRRTMEHLFSNPPCKKMKLWEMVAQRMKEEGNYSMTRIDVTEKWKNLLQTYRKNKDKFEASGESQVKLKWEYFFLMEELFQVQSSILHANNVTAESPELVSASSSSSAKTGTLSTAAATPKTPVPPKYKVEIPSWFDQYLNDKELSENDDTEGRKIRVDPTAGVRLLIRIRHDMDHLFKNPPCRRIKLWKMVAQRMKEEGHYSLSADELSDKWKNLLQTYRKNKDKSETCGRGAVKWEFFSFMEDYFSKKSLTARSRTKEQSLTLKKSLTARSRTKEQSLTLLTNSTSSESLEVATASSSGAARKRTLSAADEMLETSEPPTTKKKKNEEPSSCFDECMNDESAENDDMDTTNKESGKLKVWTSECIELLFNIRHEMDYLFKFPPCKKMKLWEIVAEKMKKEGNYSVTRNDVKDKWKNLLQTYRKNKTKMKTEGKDSVKWEFFPIMEEMYDKEPSLDSSLDQVRSSILHTKNVMAETRAQPPMQETHKIPKSNEEPPSWFVMYLNNKNKEDKKREDRYLECFNKLLEVERAKLELFKQFLEKKKDILAD